MTSQADAGPISPGATVRGAADARIGRVDAAFVDYLLVRTFGMLPVDLYVPTAEAQPDPDGRVVRVEVTPEEAYHRWHRPLRSVSHQRP